MDRKEAPMAIMLCFGSGNRGGASVTTGTAVTPAH